MLGHNYLSTTTEFLCLLLEIVTNIIFAPKERICNVCPHKMTTKPLVSPLQFLSMLGLSWLSADYPLSLQFLSMSDHPLHHSHWISFSQTRKKSWKDLEKFLQVSKKTQSCLKKGLEKSKMVNNFQYRKIQVTPWSRPLPAKSKGEACDTVANPWTTVFWPERIKDDHGGESEKWEHLTILLMCPNQTVLTWSLLSWTIKAVPLLPLDKQLSLPRHTTSPRSRPLEIALTLPFSS